VCVEARKTTKCFNAQLRMEHATYLLLVLGHGIPALRDLLVDSIGTELLAWRKLLLKVLLDDGPGRLAVKERGRQWALGHVGIALLLLALLLLLLALDDGGLSGDAGNKRAREAVQIRALERLGTTLAQQAVAVRHVRAQQVADGKLEASEALNDLLSCRS
jgi:hypothetical protein